MSYYYALRAITISQIWWLPLYLGGQASEKVKDYIRGEEVQNPQRDRP